MYWLGVITITTTEVNYSVLYCVLPGALLHLIDLWSRFVASGTQWQSSDFLLVVVVVVSRIHCTLRIHLIVANLIAHCMPCTVLYFSISAALLLFISFIHSFIHSFVVLQTIARCVYCIACALL